MINLNLSPAELTEYIQVLSSGLRQIRATLNILDKDERTIGSLTSPHSQVIGGAVQIDATADITRALGVTISDPHHTLVFADSPDDGALYADKFLQAFYGVWLPTAGKWVDVPIFTGRITSYERATSEVNVEAQGKESLSLAPCYQLVPMTIPPGTVRGTALRTIMDARGETKYRVMELPDKTIWPINLLELTQPWNVVKARIAGPTRQAYYNGLGELCVRPINTNSVFTFKDGEEGILTSLPTVRYDMQEVRNHVVVYGPTPTGSSPQIRSSAALSDPHPLSSTSLSRNGKKLYLLEVLQDTEAVTITSAHDKALEVLARREVQSTEVSFDCLPIPHLEEKDTVQLSTREYDTKFEIQQMTIPLTAGETMSVGYNKKIVLKKKVG